VDQEPSSRPTIGKTLRSLEEEAFVGRDAELAHLGEWLRDRTGRAAILNVTGPGGVGKSALLEAFAQLAAREGRPSILADGGTFRATPEAFLDVVGGGPTERAIARLNEAGTLLMIDTFEEITDLEPYLQRTFLPALSTEMKVVIAGRFPLGSNWGSWLRLIDSMELRSLTALQANRYLQRRGFQDEELCAQILRATRGHPLALSLAADIVRRFGVRDLEVAPEWRLALRGLVRELLRDIRDPKLTDLLEAAAMVREFDQQTLWAVTGESSRETFDQLCRLSVVRPSAYGLMLHDDIRKIVAEDLRWRRPDRYREIRGRAIEHLRDRVAADSVDRERLIAERLYLVEDDVVRSLLFHADDPRMTWVEPGHPRRRRDRDDVTRLWREGTATGAQSDQLAWLERLLDHPALRLRFARDREDQRLGFNTSIRLYGGSLPLLRDNQFIDPVITAYFSPEELADLPGGPEESDVWYLLHLAHGPREAEGAQAALLRDILGVVGLGGTYLTTVARPDLKRLVQRLGFQRVGSAGLVASGSGIISEGFALDLTTIGVEAWMDAIVAGRPVVRGPRRDEIQQAVHRALVGWHDDADLADSPLSSLASGQPGRTRAEAADAVRELLLRVLERARATGRPEQILAYRALELAYLETSLSHDRAAERLNVSRSTFYRLLKRGTKGLARELTDQP
jgi:hypothetical protein